MIRSPRKLIIGKFACTQVFTLVLFSPLVFISLNRIQMVYSGNIIDKFERKHIMDPSFLLATTHVLQQNQLIRAQAARELEEQNEQNRKIALLEYRREKLSSINTKTNALIPEVDQKPLQTLITLQVILNRMSDQGIAPDSFEDEKDKEDAILLWRKLINLVDKCNLELSEEQLNKCLECMDAIYISRLIEDLNPVLDAYVSYFEKISDFELKKKKKKKQANLQKLLIVITTTIFTLGFIFYSWLVTLRTAAPFLVVWILVGLTILMVGYHLLDRKIPKDLFPLENELSELYKNGVVEYDGFWSVVKERFNGIPTHDDILKRQEEANKIIGEIFPETNETNVL